MAGLTLTTGIHEKFENAHRLRMEIIRRVLAEAAADLNQPILRASFGRDSEVMASLMEAVASKRR